ncbi:MAG: site-specific integrase, partial [Prevotellaceae bacterium]|nr:site-specific integrase [Prevotellaceae bacterium]
MKKKWYIQVSQRDPRNGEMMQRRFETFEGTNINSLSQPDARRELAKKIIDSLNRKLAAGWSIFAATDDCVYDDQLQYSATSRFYKEKILSNNNYAFWVSQFIATELSAKDAAPDTMRTYKSRYRVFGNWLKAQNLDAFDCSALDREIILNFFAHMRNDKHLVCHTYNSYKQLLFSLFNYILKKGGIHENPVKDIPENKRHVDNGAERIERFDLEKLIKSIDAQDPQTALACRFQYYCGLRPGYEVRLLKIADLDLREGVSKVTVKQENAKTNKLRTVAIPDVFCEYLVRVWHLDVYDKDLYVFGKHGMPGTVAIGKNAMRNKFNKVRNSLGLPTHYKFYSMKHTGAVTLAEQGESIINIRDHLGHTSVSTTEIYLKRHGLNESEIIRKN